MKKFILNSLTIGKAKGFEHLEGVEFKFNGGDYTQSDFFTSLIIGPNATGKSRLLRLIVQIFNDLNRFIETKEAKFTFKSYYKINYILDGHLYEVENNKHPFKISRDGESISIQELKIPNKIIACSNSITDRFPFQIKKNSNLLFDKKAKRFVNKRYEYLGLRTFNNMGSSNGHITRTIDLLFSKMLYGGAPHPVLEVFKTLNIEPVIGLTFKIRNRSVLQEVNAKGGLRHLIESMDESSAGFSYRYYEMLRKDSKRLEELFEFVSFLQSKNAMSERYLFLELDLHTGNVGTLGHYEPNMLELLRKLNLISYKEFRVTKNGNTVFDFNSASSGEVNLLTSLISIACTIEANSLILIDEPEISLHPNWQMQFLDLLNKVFSDCPSCHFVICTHSHFIVSDLKPKSTYILSLQFEQGKLIAKPIGISTFGRSAEEILLRVFKLPTSRNYYVAEKVGTILELVADPSKKENSLKIKELVSELIALNLNKLSTEDPLHDVISKLIVRYGAN